MSNIELSRKLIEAVESTHVAFEGLSHPLRLVGAEPDPPPPGAAEAATLTVETTHNGEPRRATCRVGLSALADERHVATALAETMREVLAGELDPGATRSA